MEMPWETRRTDDQGQILKEKCQSGELSTVSIRRNTLAFPQVTQNGRPPESLLNGAYGALTVRLALFTEYFHPASYKPYNSGTVSTIILQVRKLRLREEKPFTQGNS